LPKTCCRSDNAASANLAASIVALWNEHFDDHFFFLANQRITLSKASIAAVVLSTTCRCCPPMAAFQTSLFFFFYKLPS
jgi:hypothetical protein